MHQIKTDIITPADFLLASKNAEIQHLNFFYRIGGLVVIISDLVHSLQKERGASNIYLGSEGKLFHSELQAQIQQTDQNLAALHQFLAQHFDEFRSAQGNSLWLNNIGSALFQLNEIISARQETFQLAISTKEQLEFYTRIISALLNLVFETVDIVAEPQTANTLITLFHLMHGKEYIGQERALGSAGFAKGSFSDGQKERHHQIVDKQQRSFDSFEYFANDDIQITWIDIINSPLVAKVNGFRDLIHHKDRFNPDISHSWFESITQWIDQLKMIEVKLQMQFQKQIEQQISLAKENLENKASEVKTMAEQGETNEPLMVTIFANDAQEVYQQSGVGKRMSKYLFELLQDQAHRLEQANDALEDAKNALQEQKQITRAKAMLMKHQKLSEDEAYQFIRKLAMNSSKKMSDVAAQVILQLKDQAH
ncbi:MAG: nitrate- and nitrite sensing domain-containing protein [Pseudomonadota bacterium]|nr:nitrate- and nitrite sensing domain-containing protein [Pseudomonadota bacterium]